MAALPRWQTRYFLCTTTIWISNEMACHMYNSNPIWRQIQDGGPDIFNAVLQYGYQMKGLVKNNSKTKVTFL
jgi:hypothetical protein